MVLRWSRVIKKENQFPQGYPGSIPGPGVF